MKNYGNNPLFDIQRENAGSVTFSKYAYQYHWALYRVMQEHAVGNEYAVFMEMHEDVVLSNSLDETKAQFEFNQVKTNKGKFNAKTLIKLKSGSSILGKLLSSSKGKTFSNDISSLNLVSVNGFALPLKKTGLTLNKIAITDLHSSTIKELTEAIKLELSIDPLPANLHFLIPDLPDNKFQDLIIAEISKLITALFSNPYYDSVEIYRVLYDDITRKGMITYDIKKWNDFLSSKALTSNTVTQVINQFTNVKDEAAIRTKFNTIISELGLNVIKAKSLEKCFNRYRQNRLGNRSTLQIDTTKEITSLITQVIEQGTEELNQLLLQVENELPKKIKDQFTNKNESDAAIIYEFIIQQ
jgi:hypothetical protein